MRFYASAAIGMLLLLCLPVSSQAAAPEATAAQAAATILSAQGRPVVVVFMSSGCPRCQAFMPVFNKFATEQLGRKARVLVFAIDHTKEALDKYLAENRLSFDVTWIQPWERGELTKAMEPTGVRIGSSFGLPLLAVLDAKGKSLGQWEGMSRSQLANISDALK
jgi:thiol-disulfide isomerase/thioredoxin